VGDLVGATLARQQVDRERMTLAVERATRAVAEQTENRARLLSKASKALVASFDSDGTLSSLAWLIVPQLGHWCAIALRRDSGRTAGEQVVWVQVDPSSVGECREVRGDRGPVEGAGGVIATCQPELHGYVTESFLAGWARSPEQLRLARALGLASAMVVPIAGHGAVLGAIALGASDRRYAPEDVAAAEEIGLRTGTAIENARLYLQAQQAIGVRDQFLAIASHELKTPLTALMLVVDAAERALERSPAPSERMRANVAALSRQGQRLTKLVSNLLDVTRIRAGLFHVSVEPMDLCAVVREVAARHEPEAARAGCALEVVTGDAITAAWDPGRVDQVVGNLLSNALKYGAGKPVSLVTEVDGDVARLSVTDHGIGIAPEDHERIFQRFERAVPDGGPEGMGLGLWITREIVVRLGGSIRVESAPGAGARFIVELPLDGAPVQR
jgi:signal transduction histidine kinase